jgi:hypothetical protein
MLALATACRSSSRCLSTVRRGPPRRRRPQAQQHAEEIASSADKRIEAARQDAATNIAQARETASKAQVTSDVLAAPDLVRFNLTVAKAPRACRRSCCGADRAAWSSADRACPRRPQDRRIRSGC